MWLNFEERVDAWVAMMYDVNDPQCIVQWAVQRRFDDTEGLSTPTEARLLFFCVENRDEVELV